MFEHKVTLAVRRGWWDEIQARTKVCTFIFKRCQSRGKREESKMRNSISNCRAESAGEWLAMALAVCMEINGTLSSYTIIVIAVECECQWDTVIIIIMIIYFREIFG